MSINRDGQRPRFYLEREKFEAQQGNPLRADITQATRRRIAREISSRTHFRISADTWDTCRTKIADEMRMVFGVRYDENMFETETSYMPIGEFLQFIEIAVDKIATYVRIPRFTIDVLQSLLADDLSLFRIVDGGREQQPRHRVQRLDNLHLQSEIVDRTFELTREPMFASAQGDYAEAWKHYVKGDLDDAVVNAHKAFESAAKVVIKHIDSTSMPDQLQTNQIVPELVRLDVLPKKLNNMVTHLQQIFASAGSLRNQAGIGHGALVPTSPVATVALMALRMSGTLVSFLAERRLQMKP